MQARLSRLTVATQQVWEINVTWRFKQGWLTIRFWLAASSGCTLPKASSYLSKLQSFQNQTSITPQSPLRRVNLTNGNNHTWLYQAKPNQSQVPLIMWGSMPLMTMSTAVVIVLHTVEVVHVPHESWLPRIAEYSLYGRVPLHTSGVCARTSLQGCSMVFPSL
jgi:hypothetical protein